MGIYLYSVGLQVYRKEESEQSVKKDSIKTNHGNVNEFLQDEVIHKPPIKCYNNYYLVVLLLIDLLQITEPGSTWF